MTLRTWSFSSFVLTVCGAFAQLPVARDTITVIENNYVLKMPWANGINHSNISAVDLNFDLKKDLVVFDRINNSDYGRFRCFINSGNPGEIKYVANPLMSYSFPEVFDWAIFLDYNGDGMEDLFCSTNGGIMVYKNESTPANPIRFTLVKPLIYSNFNPSGSNILNLYASTIGVPGISDIDNDGDLDILTFSPQGVLIEYHKNMSKEKYNHSDSLVFQKEDDCWGNISESDCTVNFNVCGPRRKDPPLLPTNPDSKTYHAGSCMACIDSDGDGDKDLIMGDVGCDIVHYVHNTGSPTSVDLTDTTRLYPNYPNKSSINKIKMNFFPCTYYLDVDNDGKKDLVATPNAYGTENYKSLWYYKNASLTNTVNFQFVKKNLLQDEMIEVGQNSFPVLFDHNADGKKDLLIGTFGYYNGTSLNARLTLYQNTGTLSQPVYSLITRDYGNLSVHSPYMNNVMPTVGDIDGDGDQDILMGTASGQVHWLVNTAGPNAVCNFSVFKSNPFAFTTISAVAAPQLFDLDGDTKLDLLIGTRNGRISFYKNTGTPTSPSFSLISSFLGNVDVKGDPYIFNTEGYATPFFYREASGIKLLVGSVDGHIFHYNVPSATAPFSLIDNQVNGLVEGRQSTVWFEDVNNDGKRDLFLGNSSGGLSFFSSASLNVGVPELNPGSGSMEAAIFPNPANSLVTLQIHKADITRGDYRVTDVLGKTMLAGAIHSNAETIDLSSVPPGIYFIKITIDSHGRGYHVTKKIVKE